MVAVSAELAHSPRVLRPVSTVLWWAGYWPGIVAVAAVALYTRRVRLGTAAVLAGAASRTSRTSTNSPTSRWPKQHDWA
jgi:undecaprenyl-diphosphatase